MRPFTYQITLFVFLLSSVLCLASPPRQDTEMYGIIKIPGPNGSPIAIGSAFVCGHDKDVVTCAHVAIDAAQFAHCTNLYYVAPNMAKLLKLKYCLPRYDLAVYSPDSEIPGDAFPMGDFKKVRPNDTIWYVGYDAAASTPDRPMDVMRNATITAIGSTVNDGAIVDFIEFQGKGRPGYSGGPVFNESGELIAIMREAWTKQGVKGGTTVLINRAFSIDVLRMQYEPIISNIRFDVTNSPGAIPVGTNGSSMTLLDELGFPSTNNAPVKK